MKKIIFTVATCLLCFAQAQAQTDRNHRINDVLSIFNSVPGNGTRFSLNGEPDVGDMAESHVQGVVRYNGQYVFLATIKRTQKGCI